MGQSKRDRTEALRKWNRDSIVLTEASVQIALYNLKKLVQSGVLVPDNDNRITNETEEKQTNNGSG